jgi:hypothetical protein
MNKLLLLIFLIPCSITARVLLITHSYNRPDFIELHVKIFKTFLQDEYEYAVFNDASDENMRIQIEQTCQRLGICCFRIPQHLHLEPGRASAGHRHMDGIKYSLEQIGYDYSGIVAFVDSDMFLLKPFSIEKYLQGYDIAGERQGRANDTILVRYLSPALVFMDMRTLPNRHTITFEGGCIHGLACDVGAHTYYYLENNPSVQVRYFGLLHIGAWKVGIECQSCTNMSCESCMQRLIAQKFENNIISFIHSCPDDIEFFLDNTFLHYRSGSNWNNKPASYHIDKTNALNKLLLDLGVAV